MPPSRPAPDEIPRYPKVWGEEHWIVNRDYCGKKLVLREGWRCSLHYHRNKDEVFYLISGRVLLEHGDGWRILEPGQAQRIAPGTVHRFWGLQDSEIIEFSTHHEDDDSFRLETSGPFSDADLAPFELPAP
jgi:mannose-6-phosphate isomerase-like protein (cupin superfamily)